MPGRREGALPFHIREATSADVPALARLHVQTFNQTHCGGRDGGPTYGVRERQWREAFTVTARSPPVGRHVRCVTPSHIQCSLINEKAPAS
jgi:hypothetical protein